jgi:hypothetical protein
METFDLRYLQGLIKRIIDNNKLTTDQIDVLKAIENDLKSNFKDYKKQIDTH